MEKNHAIDALRVGLGVLFIGTGISKLLNPAMITGLLASIGFPAATFWAWLLIIVETLGGALILLGYKSKYVSWPLIIVIVVAILTVTRKDLGSFLKDFSILGGLVSLALSESSGCCSLDEWMK